jgi:hypothetical protein
MASQAYQFPTILNNPNQLLSKARLTSLNLSYFKIVGAMELKLTCRDSLEGQHFLTKFNENLPTGSKDIHR